MQPSATRLRVFWVLIVSIFLTVGLSIFGAYRTGKYRLACTKGIIFAATVFVTFLTVLAMIVVRRAPQEALLTGLLEIVTGFTLLTQLDDFI